MAKIYVSATFLDLEECRRQVSLVIRKMGHDDVAMEYYVAEDQRNVDRCLADVAACDLYVGVFAWRYGWIPKKKNPKKLSITELEYRKAIKERKQCLIFLQDGVAPWPPEFIDDKKKQIKKFRDAVAEKHSPGFFKSDQDIGSIVAPAIHDWMKKSGRLVVSEPITELQVENYFAALRKRFQILPLEGLTPPQREEYLQIHLRSVFVEQNVRENPPPVELPKEVIEKLQREKEIHPDDLPAGITLDDIRGARTAYFEKPSRSVLDMLTDAQRQHTIILGDPGSGKSTLARYILLALIDPSTPPLRGSAQGDDDEKLRRAFDGHLPLLIELRVYAGLFAENKCETFLEFLEYLGKTEGWHLTQAALHNHLKNDGRAVIIFDGLDEIFDPDKRDQITRQIVGFASDYPKARVIVTSRSIGYRRKILTDAGFTHFALQDLDEKQVAVFVNRWYDLALSDRPDEAKERRERILQSFKQSASIRQLAGNPMLLTIMAIIGKHQELPRERWKLYDHAASVLIQHWDVNKHLKDQSVDVDFIGEEDKKELLRRLAFKMQAGESGLAGNYIHGDQLRAEFESYLKDRYSQTPERAKLIAEAMIEQFRVRNFILSLYGANLYGFVHRAFLEYFCASAFVLDFEKTKKIDIKELKEQVYGKHWQDQNWHEVLRLICGMIDEKWTGEITDYLIEINIKPRSENFGMNIALAIWCLSEVRNPGSIAIPSKRLLQTTCAFFERGILEVSYRFYDMLLKQVAPAAQLIGTNWPLRASLGDFLESLRLPDYSWIYAESFGILVGSVGAGLDKVHRALWQYAKHSNHNYRTLALPALANGFRDDPQTRPLLRDRAVNDAYENIRGEAVRSLAQHFRDDAQTLPLLRDRAVNDPHQNVRSTAVGSLAQHFRDDAQTLPLVRDRAVNDPHQNVRGAAVGSLVEHFRDDAQTLPLVRDRAVNDAHEDIRGAAIGALAEYFRDDAQTLALVRERAVNDAHESVRSAAVGALVKYFRDDAQTLALLRDRAVNDPHQNVRSTAVGSLAQHFRDDAQTLALVRDRAVNDAHEDVRGAAVESLVEHFRDDAQTLPLVRDRAVNDPHQNVRRAAVGSLVEHFRDDAQTLPLVRDRAVNDAHEDVRGAAIGLLAQHFRDDAQTLPLVRERAVNDPHQNVRSTAVRSLAQHFRDDAQTLALVRDRAVNDAHEDVRGAAVESLVEHFRDDAQTLSLVRERAVNDAHEDVRTAAVEALGENFAGDPLTLPLLIDRALNDSSPAPDAPNDKYYVREKAIEVLDEHWHDQAEAINVLHDRAANDPTEWLRERTKKKLQKIESKKEQ